MVHAQRFLIASLVVVGAAVPACSDPPDRAAEPAYTAAFTPAGSPTLTRGTPRPGPKPPVEASALQADYREELAAIGLVLTDRGGLIDRSNGGYVRSASGDHLALYLEPPGKRTMREYVDGIVASARVFVPDVFERWPGLHSFDVCQEPLGPAQELRDPPPVSQIEVTREQAAAIDWETVTLADLVDGAAVDPPRLRLHVSDELRRSEEFLEAAG